MIKIPSVVMLGTVTFLGMLPLALATIIPITAITSPGFDTNPELDGQTLTGITGSGTTFTAIQGATAVTSSGSEGIFFDALNEGLPANNTEAFVGLSFTRGRTNMQQTDWSLPLTVNDGDPMGFFIGEISLAGEQGDDVVVQPLSGGTPIAGWTLSINPGNWGAQSSLWNSSNIPASIGARLTAFDLSDFTGGAGTLTGVDGLRLLDPGPVAFDPNLVGVYSTVIPEPSTIGLIFAGFAVVSLSRRTRNQ